jgi:hypothetical protein
VASFDHRCDASDTGLFKILYSSLQRALARYFEQGQRRARYGDLGFTLPRHWFSSDEQQRASVDAAHREPSSDFA